METYTLKDDNCAVDKYIHLEKEWSGERWAFDNISNLFIIIILMQINAGILIDKFGEMKDEEKEKMQDR